MHYSASKSHYGPTTNPPRNVGRLLPGNPYVRSETPGADGTEVGTMLPSRFILPDQSQKIRDLAYANLEKIKTDDLNRTKAFNNSKSA
jgi:hypothetical protein